MNIPLGERYFGCEALLDVCWFTEMLPPREIEECNFMDRREGWGEVFGSELDMEAEMIYAPGSFGSTREVKDQNSVC